MDKHTTTTGRAVNINAADAKALCTLPGVGRSLAQAIISDREARGVYTRPDDLRRVPGIGTKTWARIASLICVGGAQGGEVEDVKRAPSADEVQALDDVASVWAEDEEVLPPGPGLSWTRGQVEAIKAIRHHMRTRRGEIFTLKGYAGTGKTTLLKEALRPLAAPTMLAPTAKAVALLEAAASTLGGEAMTLHRWLGYDHTFDEETGKEVFIRKDRPSEYDPDPAQPVVIDEVSMVGSEMWAQIKAEVARFGLMCVAMGDPLQLPPIGEDASPAWAEASGVELTEVMRSSGILTRVVLAVREHIQSEAPPVILRSASDGSGAVEVIESSAALLDDYIARIKGGRDAMLVAWTNEVVRWTNARVRAAIVGEDTAPFVAGEVLVITKPYQLPGSAARGVRLPTETRVRVMAAERTRHPRWGEACWALRVSVLGFESAHFKAPEPAANDDEDDGLGLVNTAPMHLIYALDEEQERAHKRRRKQLEEAWQSAKQRYGTRHPLTLEAFRQRCAYMKAYAKQRPGYATTVHKSQGSTWAEVYVVQNNILLNRRIFERNRMLYVAYSRAARRLVVKGGVL